MASYLDPLDETRLRKSVTAETALEPASAGVLLSTSRTIGPDPRGASFTRAIVTWAE
jgi:hypothetical protein